MAKQGVKDIEKHLIVKPFVGNTQGAAEEKYRSRKKVIGQCGTAIFVFGEKMCIRDSLIPGQNIHPLKS